LYPIMLRFDTRDDGVAARGTGRQHQQ